MSQDHICTPFELKQFTFSFFRDNLTAFEFAKFIESKSEFRYTVIEVEFIIDAFRMFEEQASASFEISKNFYEKWKHIEIPRLRDEDA